MAKVIFFLVKLENAEKEENILTRYHLYHRYINEPVFPAAFL